MFSSLIICSSWNVSDIWLLKQFIESEQEVAEAVAKFDSYTSNKNKNLSCE